MAHNIPVGNPFMLLLDPEVVLAAVAASERLGGLARRTCHPLDRPVPTVERATHGAGEVQDDEPRLN